MTGAEIMAAVGFFMMLLGAVSGIWWRIEGRIKDAKSEAAGAATIALASANTALERLAEHKLHVAETYVSKAGHREATEQIMEAITAVKNAVEGTNQRIDRLYEAKPPTRRAS